MVAKPDIRYVSTSVGLCSLFFWFDTLNLLLCSCFEWSCFVVISFFFLLRKKSYGEWAVLPIIAFASMRSALIIILTYSSNSFLFFLFSRRLARRGGVKRISGQIYEDARAAIVNQLKRVSHFFVPPNADLIFSGIGVGDRGLRVPTFVFLGKNNEVNRWWLISIIMLMSRFSRSAWCL